MKTFLKWALLLLVLGGLIAAGSTPAYEFWKKRNQPNWRLVDVTRGRIVSVVNATGSVKPVRSLTVGSFVSGPIDGSVPIANFNDEVKAGDLLCKIDPRIYDANLQRDQATLASRMAEQQRAEAQLEQAQRDLDRAVNLREQDKTFISQAEMDKFYYAVKTSKAQVEVAASGVSVAQSQVEYSQAQVKYCEIVAPEAGIIIKRKIDPGQTLAAQFQAPELFVIAPNMRERMDIHASVDETEIGLIRDAQVKKLPVTFTVGAYGDTLFHGTIEEVRMDSTTTSNVVTYPVLVATTNPDLKLLPGMTASISFQVDDRQDVVKIPNAALRFFPNAQHVRKQDKPLIEGIEEKNTAQDQQSEELLSAEERSELRRKRNRRHVWVVDGESLKAVEVEVGLSDSHNTELVKGDLKPGDKLVTGIKPPSVGWQ